MGDTRRLSAISWASESPSSSGSDSASEDWESLSCNMNESLSSSIHLSGEVDADEFEFAPLEKRRAILRVGRMLTGMRKSARREGEVEVVRVGCEVGKPRGGGRGRSEEGRIHSNKACRVF